MSELDSENKGNDAKSERDKATVNTSGDHNPSRSTDEVQPKEIGGRDGPDPTRYGDWEKAGRCIDF
ncbi:MAG: DUF1674 domain-containing protein [Gammaproteobacteria bacterium]|nr:DUF1674 domain-containing protein [Gammaproteobacteria bacterium]